MALFSDDFNRPNGTLGSNWNPPAAIVNGEGPSGGASAGIQLLSDAYAPLSNFAGLAVATYAHGSFGNDQWAQASIAAIAPFTSVVAITAALRSGSNTTYTYTLSSGSALIMGQQMYVSGMAHGGNNSTTGFLITGLGAGTFTVVNASGVTATEAGTGTSPSDSNTGLVLRGSADGQTGYFLTIGPNSGQVGGGGTSTDQRVYTLEIWKVVSGVTTILRTFSAPITSIPDSVNDIYTFAVTGTTLTLFHNGVSKGIVTDAAIASGTPGIMAWAISGAGEWANPTFYDTGSGNSGNQWTHWIGADFTATNTPYFDTFIGTTGTDLHAYNANWVNNSGTLQIEPGNSVQFKTGVASNALASWQGATFANDQWAQITIATAGSTQSIGPAVRVASSANTGYFYRQDTATDRVLFKVIAGAYTLLATSNNAHTNASGDVLRLVAIGTNLYCYLNGVLENFGVISDSSLSAGFPGLEAATLGGTETGSGFAAGNAGISGNVGVAGATITLGGAGSGTTTSDSNGNYSFNSGIVDGTYTVTPSLAGHAFTPASLTIVVAGALLFPVGENTSSSVTNYSIAGNAGMAGATVTLSGAASASTTSASDGTYSFAGLLAGAYVVTPTSAGITFTPASANETIVAANITGVNFVAQATVFTPSPLATDDFTRPDAADLGANWTVTTDMNVPLAIATHVAVPGALDGPGPDWFGEEIYTKEAFTNDQKATITIAAFGASSIIDLTVRCDITGLTGYEASLNPVGAGNLYIYDVVAATHVGVDATVVPAPGDTMAIQAVGTLITLFYNGVPLISGTRSTTAAGTPNLYIQSTATQTDTGVSLFTAGSELFIISGSCGASGAGATVKLSGAATASTTAAGGTGNYSFTGLVPGTYQVTPGLTGSMFSPSQQTVVLTTVDATGVNFTLFTPAPGGSNAGRIAASGLSFATRIESPNTSIIGTNLKTEIL